MRVRGLGWGFVVALQAGLLVACSDFDAHPEVSAGLGQMWPDPVQAGTSPPSTPGVVGGEPAPDAGVANTGANAGATTEVGTGTGTGGGVVGAPGLGSNGTGQGTGNLPAGPNGTPGAGGTSVGTGQGTGQGVSGGAGLGASGTGNFPSVESPPSPDAGFDAGAGTVIIVQ